MSRENVEIAITILEHAASLTEKLLRTWTGPSVGLTELRERARRATDAIHADLAELVDEEQAELDAAVPRAG